MILQNKAMLVSFTGRCWSARKYDKRVTRKVENIYDTSDSGRWNKVLIQLDKLKVITKLISDSALGKKLCLNPLRTYYEIL